MKARAQDTGLGASCSLVVSYPRDRDSGPGIAHPSPRDRRVGVCLEAGAGTFAVPGYLRHYGYSRHRPVVTGPGGLAAAGLKSSA